jgi:hypothetical protein
MELITMDVERRTSILKWKRLRKSIDGVQKIKQEFIKLYQHHHLVILETGHLYRSTKSCYVVDWENAVIYNAMKQKTSTQKIRSI